MKKRMVSVALFIVLSLGLIGCGNEKALEEAKNAVDNYNARVVEFNEEIESYNTAVQQVIMENEKLQNAVDGAQTVLNKGEKPFDEATLTGLKDAMTAALNTKTVDPEILETFGTLSVDETAKKAELEAITQEANDGIESINSVIIPSLPQIPDYSESLQLLENTQIAFEDSVQGLKQITTPTKEFIMERLQRVATITAMDAVTEEHDPNGQLNKQGGYTACVYFMDTQVDRSQLYILPGEDTVIDVGCDGGGAVEVFRNVEDAAKRDQYLGGMDGTFISSGSHYVYGTIVIRTSNFLSGTKQMELTDQILQALIQVEH